MVVVNLQLPLNINLPNEDFNEESNKLYNFINSNIDKNKYISVDKPRLLRLATDTNAVYLENNSLSKNPDYLIIREFDLNKYNSELIKYKLIEKIGQFNIYELYIYCINNNIVSNNVFSTWKEKR